jgi:hypothetical protein
VVTGYSQTPKLLKGALVRLGEPFLGPVPNVIVFQYNPETVTRELKPWAPSEQEEGPKPPAPRTAQPFDPEESFSLVLDLDASDELEQPDLHRVAVRAGVADRIAAIQELLYPVKEQGVVGALPTPGGPAAIQRPSVPVVLFVWGPGRIVPVRLTTFSVDEQQFSPRLFPIRAKVTVGLRTLTADAFTSTTLGRAPKSSERIASAAYRYTRRQQAILARTNLANTGESILGMLPV